MEFTLLMSYVYFVKPVTVDLGLAIGLSVFFFVLFCVIAPIVICVCIWLCVAGAFGAAFGGSHRAVTTVQTTPVNVGTAPVVAATTTVRYVLQL